MKLHLLMEPKVGKSRISGRFGEDRKTESERVRFECTDLAKLNEGALCL